MHVRSTVGTILSVIVELGGAWNWPELHFALLTCLDSNDLNHMEAAMDALSKNDPSSDVRKFVFMAFVKLTKVCTSFAESVLQPKLHTVIEYMLQGNNDSDEEVALAACEFWGAYCDAQLPPEKLREFLPRLIPILLSNMAYADDYVSFADAKEDSSVPDHDQDDDIVNVWNLQKCSAAAVDVLSNVFGDVEDMKPCFHSAEDDDDDVVNVWNLRKCTAAAIGALSNMFGDEILPTLIPLVQAKLSNSDDETWKEREAAVLALGVVAKGCCITGLYPHLSEIIANLVPLVDDKFPLIRSVSCWTLSCFSKFILEKGVVHEQGYEQFDKVLLGLLRRILDDNKPVQEAACSAFLSLEEEAADSLIPHLEIILQHLMCALELYQKRNLRIVYDAIGALADAVGGKLNRPTCIEILMPPLIAKWQKLLDSDKDLFPLLECFNSIAQALGTGFSSFSETVVVKCISIIQSQQLAKLNPVSSGVQYDEQFIAYSLGLLSGLAYGLGSGIESLVRKSILGDLLLQCCKDDASDVRLSAFALLGVLARVCPHPLHPQLVEFLDFADRQLHVSNLRDETLSVASNACWAIGQLAVNVLTVAEVKFEIQDRQKKNSVIVSIMSNLVLIMQDAEEVNKRLVENSAMQELNKALIENSAATLGRLAWAWPEFVAPKMKMKNFMQSWCIALSMIRDDRNKVDAFRGLCALVRENPPDEGSLKYLFNVIASWHEIKNGELNNAVRQVLHDYKKTLGTVAWERLMSSLDLEVEYKLSKYEV